MAKKATARSPMRSHNRKRPLYNFDLDLATVEALEQGRCPESLANFAHSLLRWRRDAIRATTPEKAHILAEAITAFVFGAEAQRLVLTIDTPKPRTLGGWSRASFTDAVLRLLKRS